MIMKNNISDEDLRIGQYLRDNLPQARKDEWFVRKTMNRLPPKQQHIFSNAELISYIAGAAVLIAWGVYLCSSITSSQVWTSADMLNIVLFTAGWAMLAATVLVKVVKAS